MNLALTFCCGCNRTASAQPDANQMFLSRKSEQQMLLTPSRQQLCGNRVGQEPLQVHFLFTPGTSWTVYTSQ